MDATQVWGSAASPQGGETGYGNAGIFSESGVTQNNLTEADLTAIYSADYPAADSEDPAYPLTTVTLENEDENAPVRNVTVGPEGSGADIVPFLPQSGSGTRSFWLGQLGLVERPTSGTIPDNAFGSAVSDTYGSSDTSVQEHDGSVTEAVPNAIVPFSIAQYIAQGNAANLSKPVAEGGYGVTVVNRRHGVALGKVAGAEPLNGSVLNTSFPIARPVFIVAKYTAVDDTVSSDDNDLLKAAFVGTGPDTLSQRLSPSLTTRVVEDFGFGYLEPDGTPVGTETYVPGSITLRGDL